MGGGGALPLDMSENGKGEFGGWGGDRQGKRQVHAHRRLSKLPFSKLPSSCSLKYFLMALKPKRASEKLIALSSGAVLLQTKKKTVATAGRSYGGPSEKFVGVLGRNFQSLAPNLSKVASMWKSPDAPHCGATS